MPFSPTSGHPQQPVSVPPLRSCALRPCAPVCLARGPSRAPEILSPVCLATGHSPAPEILRSARGRAIFVRKRPPPPAWGTLAFESVGALWFEGPIEAQSTRDHFPPRTVLLKTRDVQAAIGTHCY